MSVLPMAVYGLEVPAGDVAIPARPDIPAAFRITMAAIDPTAEPEEGDSAKGAKPRATLKIIREPLSMDDFDDYDDESDFDEDEMNALLAEEDDEEEDDEDEEGGPSDPSKSKKARRQAAADQLRKMLTDEMELDAPNGVNGKAKGKGKALEEEDDEEEDDEDDEDDDEDDDDESIDEPEEFVICTLDPEKVRVFTPLALDLTF